MNKLLTLALFLVSLFVASESGICMEKVVGMERVIGLVMEDRAEKARKNFPNCECKLPNYYDAHEKTCFWQDSGAVDCSGLAHFLCTGKNGNIDSIAKKYSQHPPTIMDGITQSVPKHHQPYTIYLLLAQGSPNEFGGVHYFTYLKDQYISKTGDRPVRIFKSFGDMVKTDGFVCGMTKKDGLRTKNIEEAFMADRKACTVHDITFTKDEFEKLKEKLDEGEKIFFQSKIR